MVTFANAFKRTDHPDRVKGVGDGARVFDHLRDIGAHGDAVTGIQPVLFLDNGESGLNVQAGEGVQRVAVGDEVCALLAGGGYAEYALAPAGSVLPVPDGFSMAQAASQLSSKPAFLALIRTCVVWITSPPAK